MPVVAGRLAQTSTEILCFFFYEFKLDSRMNA